MGSDLLRTERKINNDGKTEIDFPVPTLSISGTKDGLFRITRVAESYYH